MTTVGQVLGKAVQGDVGLELEVESMRGTPHVDTDVWMSKGEGSLRYHGIEYVTRTPILCDKDKRGKIKYLTDIINRTEYRVIQDSPRTSLHVHTNVVNHTYNELWNQIVAWWLVENLMLKYCGEEMREGNLFCLRLCDAEGLVSYCIGELKRGLFSFERFAANELRYSAQNLTAVRKFGSLEYRCMRGVTDEETIDVWSSELHNLSRNAKGFRNPEHVLDTFIAYPDPAEFLNRLFSSKFVEQLVRIPKWKELIEENVGLVSTIAYLHDWDRWAEKAKGYIVPPRQNRDNVIRIDEFQPMPPNVWANVAVGGFEERLVVNRMFGLAAVPEAMQFADDLPELPQ